MVHDPQYVTEHATTIYDFCLRTEEDYTASMYMSFQNDITDKMRAILVDWLVEVHLKFKLLPETLYLTVNLIDRYLEKEQIVRGKLQLVGVTAMLIACKYEEIYPPIVKDFVYITDNAYSHAEILKMEQKILTALDFNITITSAYRFLERYIYLSKPTDFEKFFAQYLIEGCLVEYQMLKYRPSIMAASALYFAAKMLRSKDPWSHFMVENTKIKESELRSCARDMIDVLRQIGQNESLKAVQNKFALPKFGKVSNTKIERNPNHHKAGNNRQQSVSSANNQSQSTLKAATKQAQQTRSLSSTHATPSTHGKADRLHAALQQN